MEYYESCLEQKGKAFYRGLLEAFQGRLTFVKAEGITEEKQFLRCISAVQYDHPELFFVDFSHFQYVPFDDGWEYRPQYLYDAEETNRKRKLLLSVIKKVNNEIQNRGLKSVYQKCGYIHYYLVRNCTYDDVALKDSSRRAAYTVEGPLLDRTGVCQGIALSYRLLCMKCGIEAITVRGVSLHPGTKSYEGHAWNMIRVGECAAQIDATWDMCLSSADWPVRYDYFFLPDIEMMRDHQYVGYPICRKMQMSYFERSQTQFKELKELDVFVKNRLSLQQKKNGKEMYYFQFKMVNRKETEDVIQNYVRDLIRQCINKSFSYSVSLNSAQAVFTYKIEVE